MALTVSEKFRMGTGGREFRMYEITHDEATSAVYAVSMDLEYIEFAMAGMPYLSSTPADTSTLVGHLMLSIVTINRPHDAVRFGLPPNAASKSSIMVIGW